MIHINIYRKLFWSLGNIFISNNTNSWFRLRVTKGCARVGLIMNRKFYYVKLFVSLYKKFVKSLLLKKKEENTIYLVVDSANSYKLISSLNLNSLTQFKLLNDICVIDYPEKANRFEINYNLLSAKYNFRIFIKSYTSAYISSISGLYNSAN